VYLFLLDKQPGTQRCEEEEEEEEEEE